MNIATGDCEASVSCVGSQSSKMRPEASSFTCGLKNFWRKRKVVKTFEVKRRLGWVKK
jgi:hypothetical protein